jgi:hypothetical protein
VGSQRSRSVKGERALGVNIVEQIYIVVNFRFPNRRFKGVWWMPRFYVAMKDAVGGDTLRGGA